MNVPVINIKTLRSRIPHGKLRHLAVENPFVNIRVEILQTRARLQLETSVRNTPFLLRLSERRGGAL